MVALRTSRPKQDRYRLHQIFTRHGLAEIDVLGELRPQRARATWGNRRSAAALGK